MEGKEDGTAGVREEKAVNAAVKKNCCAIKPAREKLAFRLPATSQHRERVQVCCILDRNNRAVRDYATSMMSSVFFSLQNLNLVVNSETQTCNQLPACL